MSEFNVRSVQAVDITELNELYKSTVLTINRTDYTQAEVEDWASCSDNIEGWFQLVVDHHCILAENGEGKIVGFGSINDVGYIHVLFTHSGFQHQGIATLLYHHLEKIAHDKGVEKITSEVSITAKPFFEKQGFIVDEEQKRKANKLRLTNYKMSKYFDTNI